MASASPSPITRWSTRSRVTISDSSRWNPSARRPVTRRDTVSLAAATSTAAASSPSRCASPPAVTDRPRRPGAPRRSRSSRPRWPDGRRGPTDPTGRTLGAPGGQTLPFLQSQLLGAGRGGDPSGVERLGTDQLLERTAQHLPSVSEPTSDHGEQAVVAGIAGATPIGRPGRVVPPVQAHQHGLHVGPRDEHRGRDPCPPRWPRPSRPPSPTPPRRPRPRPGRPGALPLRVAP